MSSLTDSTRQRILDAAVRQASLYGLSALSLGDLARAAGMSKSGLYAHFGSREAVESAVVDAIIQEFRTRVWAPHEASDPGSQRLRSIVADWKRWVDGSTFAGGCPIVAVAADLGDRPGEARERLAHAERGWLRTLAREFAAVRDSVRIVSLDERLAMELHNNVTGYGYMARFLDVPKASATLDGIVDRLIDEAGALSSETRGEPGSGRGR